MNYFKRICSRIRESSVTGEGSVYKTGKNQKTSKNVVWNWVKLFSDDENQSLMDQSSYCSKLCMLNVIGWQDSRIESKPTVLTNSRLDGTPAQWRASLRKTGTTKTTNDGRHGDRESDKIHRSVSIPRTVSNRNSDVSSASMGSQWSVVCDWF